MYFEIELHQWKVFEGHLSRLSLNIILMFKTFEIFTSQISFLDVVFVFLVVEEWCLRILQGNQLLLDWIKEFEALGDLFQFNIISFDILIELIY